MVVTVVVDVETMFTSTLSYTTASIKSCNSIENCSTNTSIQVITSVKDDKNAVDKNHLSSLFS